MRRTSSRPSAPGIRRSESTTSTGARPRWASASATDPGGARVEAAGPQDLDEGVAHVRLVLDHQDPARGSPSVRSSSQASRGRQPHPEDGAAARPRRRRRARRRAAARWYDRSTGRGRSSPWSRRTARRRAGGRPRGCPGRGRRTPPPRAPPSRREVTRTSPLPRLHLAGVHDEVHRHLPEHHGVAVDDERLRRTSSSAKSTCAELLPRLHELLGLAQHLVEVDRGPRRLRGVGVGEHLAHDARRAVEPLLHRADVARRRLDVRRARARPARASGSSTCPRAGC